MDKSLTFAPLNERISVADIERLVRRDLAPLMGRDVTDTDVDRNRWGHYLCANTWVLTTSDLGGELVGNILRKVILTSGLVPTIAKAAVAADSLTQAAHKADSLTSTSPATISLPECSDLEKEWLNRISRLPFKTARQCLVFPKRYTPLVDKHSSVLHEKAMQQFEETEAANRQTTRRLMSLRPAVVGDGRHALPLRFEPYEAKWLTIARFARDVIHDIVGEFEGLSHQSFPRIGPGACRNATTSSIDRLEKLVIYGRYEPMHAPVWRGRVGIPRVLHPDLRRCEMRRKQAGRWKRVWRDWSIVRGYWGSSNVPQVCRITTVPKSYKAVRLIAVEDVCNMSAQLHIKDVLMDRMEASRYAPLLPLRHQEENQELARFAAYTNKLATFDQSHASDSNTKALVRLLFPSSWWDYGFARCVPFGFITDESDARPRGLSTFATMGCGCTFAVEALVFAALVVATLARELRIQPSELLDAVDPETGLQFKEIIRVYGDDIIFPSRFAEAVKATLEWFGFCVNSEKSFVDGRFRESCGSDWLSVDDQVGDGVLDVKCIYWPRLPLGLKVQDDLHRTFTEWDPLSGERYVTSELHKLIAMQHRLFDVSGSASSFLFEWVRHAQPDLSTSFPNEHDLTLWTYRPEPKFVWWTGRGSDLSPVLELGSQWYLVRESAAVREVIDEAFPGFDNWSDARRRAELPRIRAELLARRRKVYVVPGILACATATGFNPGVAEEMQYELALRHLTEAADSVLDLAIIGPDRLTAERMVRQALCSFRPTRLSWSALVATRYQANMVTTM